MTRLTALLIQGNDTVFASSYGPIEGKFGLYIGMMYETPSGYTRPRDLLTSQPIYDTAEIAKTAGQKIIDDLKNEELSDEEDFG